jgi:hypothetical protein
MRAKKSLPRREQEGHNWQIETPHIHFRKTHFRHILGGRRRRGKDAEKSGKKACHAQSLRLNIDNQQLKSPQPSGAMINPATPPKVVVVRLN